ncbi:hypothetical protein [Micromonospora sagamiensis]|uniref:Uncharacterized protein n=1 Tax=Micromonospora sagamiensis TaxID=47875 RepID=A0A562WKR5_9ACTN|nr:hypothetical protein [Micromonospora sagamiensis]TWJ30889.1 hypothetical protein JD81_04438 [Micromonospora sagamiensis]BCL16073.1 hypothetical protein GCM10017556_38120 [Micromonospora sagamiensis]
MARRSVRTRLVTTLTACLASALAAGVIVTAVLDRSGGHDHADHAHLDTASGLLVTSRSALRMCVEAGTGTGQDAIRADLLAGLDRAREHPNWAASYGRVRLTPETALDFGCPAARLPDRIDRTALAGPGITDDPSAYRVWVYVLDEPTADRILGVGQPADVATAELMREGQSLWPVSTALLIRQSRLGDPATVGRSLRTALGLIRAEPGGSA